MVAMFREKDGAIYSAADDSLYRPVTRMLSRSTLLERPRLNAAFARASHQRITLVSGSSGAGKSTAIDAYVKLLSGATATYVPEPAATDLLAFVRGLVTALQATHPALSHGLVAAFGNARRAQRLPTLLAQWFADRLESEDLTIVLDDLHLVDESSDVAEFVAAAIEYSAARVRWIVGVRSSEMLPIAKWLAADLIDLSIDDTTLALTADETVELAARLEVDRDRALETFSFAGSNTGRLTLSLRCADDRVSSGTLGREFFEDDLEALVAPMLRRFKPQYLRSMHALLQFPSLDDELVDRIAFGHELVERLAIEAPYAFRFPGRACFTSAFSAIAKRVSPADDALRSEAVHQVVAALEGAQRPAAATHAAASSGDADAILGLLERHGFVLMNRGYGDVVNAAVGALPTQARRQNFVALTLEAMRESDLGRHDVADAWFSHAATIAPDRITRARVQYIYGSDLLRRGRLDCIDTFETIAAEQMDAELQASATAALGAAYGTAGRWAESRDCIKKALGCINDVVDVAVRAMVYHRAAFVAVRDHDVEAAEKYAEHALALAAEHGHDEIAIASMSVLCFSAVNCKDDINKGLTLLASLNACAQRLGSAFWRRYALLVLIDLESDRGSWTDLKHAEHELGNEEIENDIEHADEALLPSRALRLACGGDFFGAYNVIAGSAQRHADPQQKALRLSEVAVYAAAAGLKQEAITAMAAARTTLRRVPFSAESMSVRARLNVTLASILTGKLRSAAISLSALAPKVRTFPRLSAFHALLQAMLMRQRGAQNHAHILSLLEVLHEGGFGGVAMMIEAIPFGRLSLRCAS